MTAIEEKSKGKMLVLKKICDKMPALGLPNRTNIIPKSENRSHGI